MILDKDQLRTLDLDVLRKKWGWFLGLGILLIVLGAMAVGSSATMTWATMVFVGWMMIVGGLFQVAHAIATKGWNGFFLDLLTGVLYVVVGMMVVANPGVSAVALTLLIAVLLILGGIFRILIAVTVRFQNRFWLAIHGAINILLGFAIWQDWPLSGLWVIGLFVGIDMMFNGLSLVMLGLAAKRLPPTN